MSLIGVDVGSSAVKAAAYGIDGTLLAQARREVSARHPQPGWWEVDPEEVWSAVKHTLRHLTSTSSLRHDPPVALAIAASGREVFPVDAAEGVLGPCIMAADLRGADIESATAEHMTPDAWFRACGYVPGRMDPVNRILWWRRHCPEVAGRAQVFLGWHEFLASRLTGRAVTDQGLASKWLVYDAAAGHWSTRRLAEFGLDPALLPEVEPWATPVGLLKPEVARELGLPREVVLGVGGFDASCAAVGSGVYCVGLAGLLCGSWLGLIVPVRNPPAPDLRLVGAAFGPNPSESGAAVFALSPNGTAVVDWARGLLSIPLSELETALQQSGPGPSPVLAVPHLSGATVPWAGRRNGRGAVLGLTLGTSRTDVIKALMESVTYDLVFTLAPLRSAGLEIAALRASGGGARSEWWMQLKADLTGLPVEVIDQPEPGTLGAALLAGVAAGAYSSLARAVQDVAFATRRHTPDPRRCARYAEASAMYQDAVRHIPT